MKLHDTYACETCYSTVRGYTGHMNASIIIMERSLCFSNMDSEYWTPPSDVLDKLNDAN